MIKAVSGVNSYYAPNASKINIASDTSKKQYIQHSNLMTPSGIYAKADISFKGWQPDKSNKTKIKSAVKLIKSNEIRRIALIAHKNPDADAISSMTAMAGLIEAATGKKADMFIGRKLYEESDFLDNAGEFNVVDFRNSTADEVKETYGQYDLAIALDTAESPLLETSLREGIFDQAKHTIKVDHHPLPFKPTADENRRYNYADLNIVDSSMSSDSQFLMQFVKPFGLNPEGLPKSIFKAIATGLVSDTNALLFAKGNSAFEDMSLLYNKVNYEEIVDKTKNMSLTDFEEEKKWMNRVKFSPDGKKAYIVVDKAIDAPISSIVKADILSKIINISGVECVFCITGNSNITKSEKFNIESPDSHEFTTVASIRSKTVNLNDLVARYNSKVSDDKKLYGGGHNKARSIRSDLPLIEVEGILVNKL